MWELKDTAGADCGMWATAAGSMNADPDADTDIDTVGSAADDKEALESMRARGDACVCRVECDCEREWSKLSSAIDDASLTLSSTSS